MADDGKKQGIRGFYYEVSDEQRRVFASLTPERRLQWLEEMRVFTWETATDEAKANWRRLRKG